MNNKSVASPSGQSEQQSRLIKIASFVLAFLGICILFIIAFNGFQPDQFSLSDRYFPSPTATPTRTPNWTATQKVIETTATAQSIQATIADVNSTWTLLLSDPFENNDNHWNIGPDNSEWADIRRAIKNGKYTWDATSKKGVFSWVTADTTLLTDFILSVDLQRTGGSKSSDYGVIFREDASTNLYYLGIDNREFFVSLNYNDEWITIIDDRVSNALHANEVNRVTIIANGAHFIILFNDQFVAEFEDDHIPKGRVGLGIQIHLPEHQADLEFDNFELREP